MSEMNFSKVVSGAIQRLAGTLARHPVIRETLAPSAIAPSPLQRQLAFEGHRVAGHRGVEFAGGAVAGVDRGGDGAGRARRRSRSRF